jgi:hypothetical protein
MPGRNQAGGEARDMRHLQADNAAENRCMSRSLAPPPLSPCLPPGRCVGEAPWSVRHGSPWRNPTWRQVVKRFFRAMALPSGGLLTPLTFLGCISLAGAGAWGRAARGPTGSGLAGVVGPLPHQDTWAGAGVTGAPRQGHPKGYSPGETGGLLAGQQQLPLPLAFVFVTLSAK